MPRAKEGARLYPRERPGRKGVWVILDTGGVEKSTGCGLGDLQGAERRLKDYLAKKHVSQVGTRDPAILPVADVLTFYAGAKAPGANASAAQQRAFEILTYHLEPLNEFWGMTPVKDIRGESCRDYVAWRCHATPKDEKEKARRKTWPPFHDRAVSDQSARRELVCLSAGVNLYHKEYGLETLPVVTMPALKKSGRRALDRSRAAALLAGALGFYRDEYSRLRRRPKSTRVQRKRVARFIIIGLYSGSRHSVITNSSWLPAINEPWIDVEAGLLHRRGEAEEETNKRRPPARIHTRLMAHLRRWRRLDMEGDGPKVTYVIAKRGQKLAGRIRKAWTGARTDGGLGPEVVPHLLRHTAGTWLAQGSVPAREAADFLGMSEKQFEKTYYTADPAYQSTIGPAFEESRRRANKLRRAQDSPRNA